MSKTKKILIGVILITIMLIGIGYAAIQNVTLNIFGTATADPSQSNFLVKFVGTPEVSDSSKVTAEITGDTTATINVEGLTAKGDIVAVTYEVQNFSSDLSARLSANITNSNEEYFIIDAEFVKSNLLAGESTTLTVMVELAKTIIGDDEKSTIGIELTGEPEQPGEDSTSGGNGNGGGESEPSAELNEYGFYFGVPYSTTIDSNKMSTAIFDDGFAVLLENEVKVQEYPEGSCTFGEDEIYFNGDTAIVSSNGMQISYSGRIWTAELGETVAKCGFWGHAEDDGRQHIVDVDCTGGHYICEGVCSSWQVPNGGTYKIRNIATSEEETEDTENVSSLLNGTYTVSSTVDGDSIVYNSGEYLPKCYQSRSGDVLVYGDYEYRHVQYFDIFDKKWKPWNLSRGWGVRVVDDTKTEYGQLLSSINGTIVDNVSCTYANCKSLTKIPELPKTVTELFATFFGCTALVTVPEIPEGVTNLSMAFSGCTALESVQQLPNSVTNLLETFAGCTALKYVPNIPNGVTSLIGTFTGCTSLETSPEIPDSVTNMFETFIGCTSLKTAPELPNGVTNLMQTFVQCKSLETAPQIPSSVTALYETFKGCTALKNIPELPNTITDLTGAFMACTSLETAPQIPSTVTNMHKTFMGCSAIKNPPEIPNGVTNLSFTFSQCSVLEVAPQIPNSVTNLASTFSECTLLQVAPQLPTEIKSLSLTFLGCVNLKTYEGSTEEEGVFSGYVIPEKVIDMTQTFGYCTSMVIPPQLPSKVINITSAFSECTSLTTAPTIPASVLTMTTAFNNCSALTGTVQVNVEKVLAVVYKCFNGTVQPIVLRGTGNNQTVLNKLARTANNGNVTVE